MHRRIDILTGFKFFAAVIIGAVFYSCAPRVEDVTYTEYSAGSKNSLIITVNTKKGLFKGREGFLSFYRDEYLFTFDRKSRNYTEEDMEVRIWRRKVIHLKPTHGTVTILDNPQDGIFVNIDIKDESIPLLINGKYRLRMAYSDSKHVWYKMK